MTDEISKAVESANKNLDNALEVAVDALTDIRNLYQGDQSTKASTMFGRASCALDKIAAILKVKQKD